MTLAQCGVLASSRSASHTLAPELSALIAILRSVGPVISTRRSTRSAGAGATCQSPSRTVRVSGRKSSGPVRATSSRRRLSRAASSSSRRARTRRCSCRDEGQRLGGEDLLRSVDGRARDLDWRTQWALVTPSVVRAAGTRERCPPARGRPRRPPARRCPGGSRRRGPRRRPRARRPGRRRRARCSWGSARPASTQSAMASAAASMHLVGDLRGAGVEHARGRSRGRRARC